MANIPFEKQRLEPDPIGLIEHEIAQGNAVGSLSDITAAPRHGIQPRSHIEIRELPFSTRGFPVAMFYHSRVANDPGLKWLREVISRSGHPLAVASAA